MALELSFAYDILYVPKDPAGCDSIRHVFGIESGEDIEFSTRCQGGGRLLYIIRALGLGYKSNNIKLSPFIFKFHTGDIDLICSSQF